MKKIYIKDFLKQLNFEVERMEALLQTESSGSKIAFAQGFCAGARNYSQELTAAEIDANESDTEEPYIKKVKVNGVTFLKTELKFKELEELCRRIARLKNCEKYENFQEIKKKEIEKRKDELFFHSEKGRDLHWYKGWYAAFTQILNWWDMLERHYEEQAESRQRNPSLFEDEDE